MCGRYVLAKPERVVVAFRPDLVTIDHLRPRYNIAPSQPVPVVAVRNGRRELFACRWGLVPAWADDPSLGVRPINARSETADVKPAFRDAFRRGRCLVPADGYYEWQAGPSGKRPFLIRADDEGLLAFAGLYARWERPGRDAVLSCAILTRNADAAVRPVHDRMPAILPPSAWAAWLDPQRPSPDEARRILEAPHGATLRLRPVSRRVNSPANDDAGCLVEEPGSPAPIPG